MNKRIRKKRRGRSVDHRGCHAWQSWKNNHVMIFRYDHMVSHSQWSRRLSKRELRKEIDRYLYFIDHMDEFFKKTKPKVEYKGDPEELERIRSDIRKVRETLCETTPENANFSSV